MSGVIDRQLRQWEIFIYIYGEYMEKVQDMSLTVCSLHWPAVTY